MPTTSARSPRPLPCARWWNWRRTVFLLPRCNRVFPRDFGKARPCLNAHIGKCMAVCSGKISCQAYNEAVQGALHMIRYGKKDIVKTAARKMEAASDRLDFETAALLRDQIQAIERVAAGQKVVMDAATEMDVIALAGTTRAVCAAVLRYREGRLTDKREFVFHDTTDIEAVREAFLPQYYLDGETVPKVIAVDALPARRRRAERGAEPGARGARWNCMCRSAATWPSSSRWPTPTPSSASAARAAATRGRKNCSRSRPASGAQSPAACDRKLRYLQLGRWLQRLRHGRVQGRQALPRRVPPLPDENGPPAPTTMPRWPKRSPAARPSTRPRAAAKSPTARRTSSPPCPTCCSSTAAAGRWGRSRPRCAARRWNMCRRSAWSRTTRHRTRAIVDDAGGEIAINRTATFSPLSPTSRTKPTATPTTTANAP